MNGEEIDSDPMVGQIVGDSIKRWLRSESDVSKKEKVLDNYHRFYLRRWIFLAVCIVTLFICMGYTLTVGDYQIGFWDCFGIAWDHITGDVDQTVDGKLRDYVIWQLRVPVVLVGVIAGVALSVCGVAMQSILKNPLADPYTTGVSSGAGFGATMAIVAGASIVQDEYAIVINAFIFSLIPTIVILLISKIKNSSPTTMIVFSTPQKSFT